MHFYRYNDLCVAANVELESLPQSDTRAADVTFTVRKPNANELRLLEETADSLVASTCRRSFAVPEGSWLQHYCETAFLVEEGYHVHGLSTRRKDLSLAGEFVDQVMPRLLTHMGRFVVHASCVAYDDQAFLFLGPSGRGKSTLALAHCELNGAELVSDDAVELFFTNGGLFARTTYSVHRVWEDSCRALRHDYDRIRKNCPNPKLKLPGPIRDEPRTYAVAAMYTVGEERLSEISLDRQSVKAATVGLLQRIFYFRESLSERDLHAIFSRCEEMAAAVPCFGIEFPREYSELPEVIEQTVRGRSEPLPTA